MTGGQRSQARRRGQVTAEEVARAAGVSRSAVSRSFTPGASVSKSTREAVMAAATELGYRPNAMARSLMTQRSNLVAVIMGQLRNPFFTDMLGQFEQEFRGLGLSTLLLTSASPRGVDAAIADALSYQVDGIIVASVTPSRQRVWECAELGVPLVVIDRQRAPSSASLVWIDSVGIGTEIAELLIAEDRQHFAVIEGRADEPLSDKAKAFQSCVLESGNNTLAVDYGDYSYEGGRAAAARLFAASPRPEAVFCVSDLTALGFLDHAKYEQGIDVPGSLSVVGFGNIGPSAWLGNALTTVELPIGDIVDSSIGELMSSLEEPERSSGRIRLPCRIIRRGTTTAG